MSTSPYAYQHYLLQSLCAEFRLPDTLSLALKPGIQSVYRVTCHYPHNTPPNTVATLIHSLTAPPELTVHFEHLPYQSISEAYDPEDLKSFKAGLARLKFDRLEDQPNVPSSGAVLWLVERAAGSFHKALLLSPVVAEGTHAALVEHVDLYLPQLAPPTGGPDND